jgi:hypothetical protein
MQLKKNEYLTDFITWLLASLELFYACLWLYVPHSLGTLSTA